MKELLAGKGDLRCFLDEQDIGYGQDPSRAMSLALQTCRHIIVVISPDFLHSKDPLNELRYALKRQEWIQKQLFAWISVWVVLKDVSIKQYSAAVSTDLLLRSLCSKVRCFEFNKFPEGWVSLTDKVRNCMVQQDQGDSCKDNWKKFLRVSANDPTFPSTSDLY